MIRYAVPEDAPRILQLIKDLAEYEKAPFEAKATLQQIEETKTELVKPSKKIKEVKEVKKENDSEPKKRVNRSITDWLI